MFTTVLILTILLLTLAGLCNVVLYSLHEFSRSRLEQICRQHQKEERLGAILRHDPELMLPFRFGFLFFLMGGFGGFLTTWTLFHDKDPVMVGSLEFWLGTFVYYVGSVLVLQILLFAIARAAGEAILFHLWPAIILLAKLGNPLKWFAQRTDLLIHRLFGVEEKDPTDPNTITEELQTVIDEGQRGGILESGAGRMLSRVMEIQDQDVASVMTPRTDMVCIQAETSLEDARSQLLDAGHSRIPIYGESPDDVIGVLYAKDLLDHLSQPEPERKSLPDIVREPLYIPETASVDKLLETMKTKHIHMAIVLDEYGGVAGLITMEDILEEIVGEISDEYDEEEDEPIRELAPGIIEIDARVHIDDLNEQFDFELPEDGDFDTIGGFVFTQLGRIPQLQETLTWQNLRMTILNADKRKIISLKIEVDESLVTSSVDQN